MAFVPFRKIRVDTSSTPSAKTVNDVQDNIASAFQQVLGKDQLDSSVLTNITLNPGTINKIPHTLGRALTGWIVIRNHGISTPITDNQDNNKSPNLLLYLSVSTYCVVDLLVF
jgi:hypothetical protein